MKQWIQIRVDIPETMDPEQRKQVEENISHQTNRFMDNLRRCLPHSVGVHNAGLSPVQSEE